MTTARRFAVLAALGLWQGGFTFYAAFVVPAGTRILGSAAAQGFITREVAVALNWVGVVALAVCLLEARDRGRFAAWLVMALLHAALFTLHPRLDGLLDPATESVINRPASYGWHRVYLWASAAQWSAALAFTVLSLLAWRRADRAGPP